MLNKSFAGSWGLASEENIPHEIINLFQSDNGKIYIYVPPYGGYSKNRNIEYILITGEWHNKKTEILYLASGLEKMHEGGKYASHKDREALRKRIKDRNIRYNGKLLYEIKMSAEEETRIFYCTFEAEKLVRPKRRMFLSWNNENRENTGNFDTFILSDKEYNYQRQIGYISNSDDYKKLNDIINTESYWENINAVKKIEPQDFTVESPNFLQLAHKEYDETAYTSLFYEFFRNYKELFNQFAKTVLGIPDDDVYIIQKEVNTQYHNETMNEKEDNQTNMKGRLDLLAIGCKNVIVIEVKIKSGLNGIDKSNELSQLTTYIRFVEKKHPNKNRYYFLFEPNYNDIDIEKFDTKRGKEFKKIKFNNIYDFFDKNIAILNQEPYRHYAKEFISSLRIHTLTMHDIITQRFLLTIHNN